MDKNEVLQLARERYSMAIEYEQENHKAANESVLFKVGDQWPDTVKQERINDRRPMLTVNKISQFVNHVVNTQRQTRPGIKVRPAQGGDGQTSEILEGLIRHIENCSHAEQVYDDGFEQSVDGGFGYWRVVTEYADENSFDQVIRIKRIRNRFSVVYDPHAQDFVKRDAKYCFIVDEMSRKEFEAEYPKAVENGWPAEDNLMKQGWITKDTIRVAEYFEIKHRSRRIALFDDGTVEEIPDSVKGKKISEKEFIEAYERNSDLKHVRSRTTKEPRVMWRKMTGFEVLEERELAGKFIPVVPCYGSVTNIDGKDICRGLIYPMLDSQRMYNYWVTHATELMALAPKAPFILTAKQVGDHATMWKQANHKNLPYLMFTPDPNNPGRPQREKYPTEPTGAIQMAMLASSELNETSALHPPVLGKRSNETSGVAIAQRQQQGDIATFHYTDNLARSIQFTGEIIVDLIPRIYDSARVVQILGEDGEAKSVQINQMFDDDEGERQEFNLTRGKYEVYVEAGPSYATKRQETASFMLEAFKINPMLMQVAGDLLFRNVDMHGADELAQRMAKMVPPELKDEGQAGFESAPQFVGAQPGGVM